MLDNSLFKASDSSQKKKKKYGIYTSISILFMRSALYLLFLIGFRRQVCTIIIHAIFKSFPSYLKLPLVSNQSLSYLANHTPRTLEKVYTASCACPFHRSSNHLACAHLNIRVGFNHGK